MTAPSTAAAASERTIMASLSGDERLRFPHLLPLGIGTLGEVDQLAIVLSSLGAVACRVGRTGDAQDPAIAIGCGLEGGLVFGECRGSVSIFEQQVAVELAQRIEPVLHRDMLEAVVLVLGRRPHEFYRLVTRAFPERNPGHDREHLLFGAIGPIGVVD